MPYGDIILQAESTQFRVNPDKLAQQSSVFRDTPPAPQPPKEPTVNGCSVVYVSDTAKDWESLLEVLYHPFRCESHRTFSAVAAMLRLGRKYEIHEAKEDALSCIRFEFPFDMQAWTNSPSDMTKIMTVFMPIFSIWCANAVCIQAYRYWR
ncbi:hypothetical protein FB451DRAFT_1295088 [Mycena latifolia]|nr:hypothetical protein FB451DRAFT_1295088 [Mycena latifolia]